MLGDTITMTLGGTGGTDRVCNKINQDNYGAEYLNRISTDEIRVVVRHVLEKATATKPAIDRHNVKVTQTVFATDTTPAYLREFYFVFRLQPGDDVDAAVDVGEAVTLWATEANLEAVAGWES